MLTVKNILKPAGTWYHARINDFDYYNYYMIPPAILDQYVTFYHLNKNYLEIYTGREEK